MKEIFNTYLDTAFDGREQACFKIKQFENNYRTLFPSNLNDHVLDIGVGRGEMLTCMKTWGYKNYQGIDISPSTIEFCLSLGLECEVVQDSATWLAECDKKFALITVLDVLEHFPKDKVISFLSSLRNALSDGGKVIVQVPNMQAPDAQLHRYNDITHEVGYVEHSLHQVLVTAGFKNIKMHGFEEFISEHWSKYCWKSLRAAYWKYIKFSRRLTGNLNPEILNPVFYAVAYHD
ncbi:class I SAM-dependent methyltransferase [Geomesophilobacter sediminis]|uniref:Class I SAM-dependent methyltransferase n=1 Tax=Geomesophilobacter sediminis TaxID=2798584 RepID=A0A8J7S9T5_9BACT|nr:class I SAM-dependent methyltransferase [Geomesophilobacter sediminis]MBJ6727030.1 class I SAM-dependent methyltransferase [Geomesophilobacter sediminis]